jgi:hypothetical protein
MIFVHERLKKRCSREEMLQLKIVPVGEYYVSGGIAINSKMQHEIFNKSNMNIDFLTF